jgi:Mg/Co/Ni transporter MgtE
MTDDKLRRVYSLEKVLDTLYNMRQEVLIYQIASEKSDNELEAMHYSRVEDLLSSYIEEVREEISSIVRIDKAKEVEKFLKEIEKEENTEIVYIG